MGYWEPNIREENRIWREGKPRRQFLRRCTIALALLLVLFSTPALASDPRPARWCGWYMRHLMNVADRAYNRAIHWRHYGTRSSGPCVGCIVVWAHHVGLLTKFDGKEWWVKSGNDGHRVRERPRSLRGAIAFRQPSYGVFAWSTSSQY